MTPVPEQKATLTLVGSEPARGADASVRLISCLAHYVRDQLGDEVFDDVAREVEIDPLVLEHPSNWIGFDQLKKFHDTVWDRLGDEARFREASVYRYADSFGPMRYLLTMSSPAIMLRLAIKTFGLVSSVSDMEVLEARPNMIRARYTTTVREHESRPVCIARSTGSSWLPTLFGLPPAHVEEESCIAHGDECCTYVFRFYTRSHWMPALAGALVGVLVAAGIMQLGLGTIVGWISIPLIGALLGLIYELRSTYRLNLSYGERQRDALEALSREQAEARSEVWELHSRQKQWAKLLEEQVAERTATIESVLERFRSLSEERVTGMRGFSHDLRNPLQVIRFNIEFLKEFVREDQGRDILNDQKDAVDSMESMLNDLVALMQPQGATNRYRWETLEVAPLVSRFRRRLRALVFGRDIRTSVFRTREAPDHIVMDRLVFERIVDNLCTNAAKYTERGSIVLELDGTPGMLVIKVVDTGRGIPPERMGRIFQAGATPERERAARSLGVGLSVVTQLLDSVGGRLEVMSKPDRGTTFWAYFPVQPEQATTPSDTTSRETKEGSVARIVRIRSADR